MPNLKIDTDQRPLVLVWEVTQACDLACDHCRAGARPQRHPQELTTAEGKALLDDARAFGDGQLVVLSGGDPLYRDDILDLVTYGTENGLRMTLTPSGTDTLSASRLAALADAGLQRLALSLDGSTPTSHDAFRGESGSFETTLRAARYAASADLPLQINTTVCDATVDKLGEIAELVGELDAILWSVFFLVPVGRGRALDPVTPERAERVMEWLVAVQQSAQFDVKTTEAPHFRRVALQQQSGDCGTEPRPRRGPMRITAGDGFAFVSHTGDVYPSGFLPESAGNVRQDSVVHLYRNHDLFRSLRDPEALQGDCGICEFRTVCGGSRSRAYASTGDPLASDPLCAYRPEEQESPQSPVHV